MSIHLKRVHGVNNQSITTKEMEELVYKINAEIVSFQNEAEKALNGNKAAGVRARKHSLELCKMLAEFRKVSVKA